MECKVEFDYVAQEPDELTIKKGDIIKNVQTKMDGWFEGTLRGKTGVFPDNFVKLIEKPNPEPKPSEVVVLRNNPNSARRVKVLFSYSPEQEDELPLDVGDILEFIEEVEEGWWRGKLKGREGIFPSNFVEEVEEPRTNGGLIEGHSHSSSPLKSEDQHRQRDSRNSLTKGSPPVPDVVPDSSPSNRNSSVEVDEPAPELPPKPVRELARCFYPYTALNEDELALSEGDIITIISKNCEDEGWWRGELRGKIGLFPDNFVKIITPGDVQPPGGGTVHHGKMLAQERNIVPPNDFPAKITKRDSLDGGAPSKSGKIVPGESKVEQAKAQLSKTNSKEVQQPQQQQQQQPIIAPKIQSPISPGIAAFHNNLFSNQKLPDAFAKSKDLPPVPRDDKVSDESEDFNSVERTETLNHLTASRAKAPKRRPPSTIITRENEMPMLNGSSHSYDGSITDSPPHHHSTPMNHSSVNSNGTMSGSYTDGGGGGSSLNHSGSFHSHNNSSSLRDKEGSPTPPTSANTSGVSAPTKPKKQQQALPWMAELKQTQDKKRSIAPPVTPAGGGSLSSSTVTPPPPTATTVTPPQPAAKEHAKAPPLPAKPSSLSSPLTNDTTSKPMNNLNHSSSINSTSTTSTSSTTATPSPYNLPSKSFPPNKKPSPSPAAPPPSTTNNHNHHHHTPSTLINSSVVDNSSHLLRGGDGDNSNSNKSYVSFEDYQALKTRVTCLENEVETLKRQLKLLLDRDLRGHIV